METTALIDEPDQASRRERIMAFMHECYWRRTSPTVREIGMAVGLSSPGSVQYQVIRLLNDGLLRRDGRHLRLVKPPEDAAGIRPHPFGTVVPLVGHIAAGPPTSTDDVAEGELILPPDVVGKGDTYALRVKGDSMIDADIFNGDLIIVRRQEVAENGDMVAAMIDGEATVKVYQARDGHVKLLPRNNAYQAINGNEATILGKVVCIVHRV
ncbi:MAG TPA: transcriptional repressor LexA [Micromonosporaceae bacterium]|nr:transcriptional repressor LexA [Micromonosporaceae bacterium]